MMVSTWDAFRSSTNAAVIRAIIGGPPVSRNNVRITNVRLLTAAPSEVSRIVDPAVGEAAAACTGAGELAECGPLPLSVVAELPRSPTRETIFTAGANLCLTILIV